MNGYMKRLTSWILVLAMVFAFAPVNVRAAETPQIPSQPHLVNEGEIIVNPLYKDIIDPEKLEFQEYERPVGTNSVAKSAYATTMEAAGLQLRPGLVQRQANTLVYYQTADAGEMDVTPLVDSAMAHTGNPKEGDALLWVWAGMGVDIYDYYYENGIYYITLLFSVTYYTTAEQEAELDVAVDNLLATLNPTGTDYEKLCTVYDYICENITYDYANLEANPDYALMYTAYAALMHKTAVCQGYALLLYRLALEMGIDCRFIGGTGNGGPHGWNIVKLGNYYYNADSTWDAIWLEGVGYYNYFLQCENTFTEGGTDHFRDAQYDTAEFHAAYPMSPTDYDPNGTVEIVTSGVCGENLTWNFADGVLTISGTGDMYNYDENAPWQPLANDIQKVVIHEGVTSIGDCAIYCCFNLTEVSIPSTLTTIGMMGLAGCPAMGNVNLPEGLTSIGAGAFVECQSITELVIPGTVTEIGYGAFIGCIGLSEITFQGNAPAIDEDVFYDVVATVNYPAGNATWTADVMQQYGGTITWVPYGLVLTAEYASISTSMAGDVALNFYVVLSEDMRADEGAYMVFTVAGKTQVVPLSETTTDVESDGSISNKFSCKLAAKQMSDTVVAQMYTSDGTPVGEAKSYTIRRYCDAVISAYSADSRYTDLVELMRAMLNYGAASQLLFNYNTGDLANSALTDTTLPVLTEAMMNPYAPVITDNDDGISLSSLSLLFESTTKVRFYFTLDGSKSIDAYTFLVDGVEVEPRQDSSGEWYVDKTDIAAKNLDKMATVQVGNLTATGCGLSYVRQVAIRYPHLFNQITIDAVRALYGYAMAANAYFE